MSLDTADLELKSRHRAMWASGDYPSMVETFLLPLGPRLVEACAIAPGMHVLDVGAGLRRRDRGVAGAGGDVEDALAGADLGRRDQARAERRQEGLDHRRVVAGGPHLPVFLLQLGVQGLGIGVGAHYWISFWLMS